MFVITEFVITEFVITEFVITEFVITEFVITEFVITKFDSNNFLKNKIQASSRGLEVKEEESRPKGPGFKPPLWRPFFGHHSFGSKLGIKIVENSNVALLHVL